MKKRKLIFKWGAGILVAAITVISFQNCSPVNFSAVETENLSSSLTPVDNGGSSNCLFNGQSYREGDSVIGYLYSSVPVGNTCVSETRVCAGGAFSGSYPFASCAAGAANACLFNGRTIAHGESVDAYRSSSVAFGATCVSEKRVCNNGVLSGSYNFAACAQGAATSCLFNGTTVAHNASITAFLRSSVAYGQSCQNQAQTRVCNNGNLSGTAMYASCTEGTPAGCIFNGVTVAHGGSISAYQTATVSYGQSCASVVQSRVCNNGNLSGSYPYSECTVEAAGVAGKCGSANGQTLASAPKSNLCSTGSPSAVSVNGSVYNWSCSGVNGGVSSSCSASRMKCAAASANFSSADGKNICTVTLNVDSYIGETLGYGSSGWTATMTLNNTGASVSSIVGSVSCIQGSDGNPRYSWSNVACPNAANVVTTCPSYGGTVSSPDGSNKCDYHVSNGFAIGAIVNSRTNMNGATTATNGMEFTVSCHSGGAWNLDQYNCPNKSVATCSGYEIPGVDPGSKGSLVENVPANVSAINPRVSTFKNSCYVAIPSSSAGQVFAQAAGTQDIPNRALKANLTCGSNGKWSGTWECP